MRCRFIVIMGSKKNFLFQVLVVEICIIAVNLLSIAFIFNGNSDNGQEPYIVKEYPVVNMVYNSTGRYVETIYRVSENETETLNFFSYSVDSINDSTVTVYSNGQTKLTVSLLDTE